MAKASRNSVQLETSVRKHALWQKSVILSKPNKYFIDAYAGPWCASEFLVPSVFLFCCYTLSHIGFRLLYCLPCNIWNIGA